MGEFSVLLCWLSEALKLNESTKSHYIFLLDRYRVSNCQVDTLWTKTYIISMYVLFGYIITSGFFSGNNTTAFIETFCLLLAALLVLLNKSSQNFSVAFIVLAVIKLAMVFGFAMIPENRTVVVIYVLEFLFSLSYLLLSFGVYPMKSVQWDEVYKKLSNKLFIK